MEQTSFYSEEELSKLGLRCYGKNVMISRKSSLYSPGKISIGDNVRIDDFCILSGNIRLGNCIHIAAYCALFGGAEGIEFRDYSGLSARGVVYAESDDYCGDYITNPTVPKEMRHVISGKVVFREHSIVGAGCIVLPGCILNEGIAVGAMSLVNKSLDEWGIYAGVPAKRLKDRKKLSLKFDLFLWPNNRDDGDFETLLLKMINPKHQGVLDCFQGFEKCVGGRDPKGLMYELPGLKAEMYTYIEIMKLSEDERKALKNGFYQFDNPEYWDLDSADAMPLKAFLDRYFL